MTIEHGATPRPSMATKPASTYILDSTNSLYTNMAGCWPMLEGSGTTTADKTSNARTATLTGGLTWGTPDSEGPNFQPSSGTEYLSLASNLVIPVNTSFSIAWACEIPNIGSDNSNTIMLGDVVDSGQNFIWMHSTTYVEFWVSGLIPAGAQTLNISSSPATRHDYLLVAAYSSGSYTLTLYQDGTADTPITGLTAGSTAWNINAILNGYSSSGYSFYGQFEYLYIWSGRALAGADAATLSAIGGGNPYSIFKSGSASFTISPSTIPANHTPSLTLTLTGTGTSWTSGSTVSVQNSVTGTTTVTKGSWTQSSGTAATLTVTTGAGTGTFTITVDGVVSPALTVDTASFTISPTSGGTGTTPTITATGTNTLWTLETASTLFSVSGGTGASISSISVTSNTAATFTLTVGSGSGTLTITDYPTGDTASFTATNYTVYSLVGPPSYIAMEGTWVAGTYNSQAGYSCQLISSASRSTDGCISFRATIATLDLYCIPNGTVVRLMIDGVDQGSSITLSASGSWGWLTCWSGLDATTEHGYRIYTGGDEVFFYINQIRTSGGTGLNTTLPMPVRPLIAGYGDSVMLGQAGNGNDGTLGHMHDLSRITGYQVANCASGSEEVSVGGETASRIADVTSLANPKPSLVFVQHGQVDVIDSVSTSTFQTAYSSMISQIRAGLPQVFIVCEALHGSSATDTSRAAYNTAIQAAVTALADRRIVYDTSIINNFNWSAYGSGGIHFNAAGSLDVAQILAAAFQKFLPGTPAAAGF